ncbi:MAG: ABC transporter substrate-binding protein [Bacteriovoracaceae bacterium]
MLKCSAFLILMLGLILSCSKEHRYDVRELHLISPEKVAGFDPIQASDRYSGLEVGKVYEGLFEFHPLKRPYELIPNLAAGHPQVSKDGLTYTFKIKSGVLFHDSPAFPEGKGRELVAEDFVYSFKRLADPRLQAKGWWLFDQKIQGLNEWRTKNAALEATNYDEVIEGLKALDKYTFQVKLTKPYPQFLYALAMPYSYVVAKEAVAHFGNEFLNHPVGTGPFILPKYDQSNRIVYVKNPTFREKFYPSEGEEGDERKGLLSDAGKKLPLVDRITVHTVVESQPKWFGLQKAKFDVLEMDDTHIAQALTDEKALKWEYRNLGMRLISSPQLDITFFAFNHEDKTFKDVRVRRAMSLAYDRKEANQLFYRGTGVIAQSIIPPGLSGFNKDFKNPYIEFNLELSKKLLAEAGFPEGKGFPEITVQTRSETTARQQIEFFAKSMEKIGIKVHVGMNTWPELINKVTKKQHQMYTMAWGADYPDAENFLGLVYCPNKAPGSNGSNYCNPEVDKMYEESVVLIEGDERTQKYEALNQKIAHEVPWIFGFHRTKFYLTQAWVKNYKFMEFNHNQAQYLSVDLEVKKELRKKF